MGKSTPQPPPAPNPNAVAAAQTGANVDTAIANTALGNANQVTPWGTSTFNQTGTRTIPGDKINPARDIPTFTQTVTLSPAEQAKLDKNNALGLKMLDTGQQQLDRVSGHLSTGVDTSGLPGRVSDIGPLPTMGRLGPNDFSADRKRVEDAHFARLEPQFERDRAALESRLVNQGHVRGSEGFDRALDEHNRMVTDARNQTILAGGAEQSRLFGMDVTRTGFNNQAGQAEFGNAATAANFRNAAREGGLQETFALRNQPINEISALMSGGQVTTPQFDSFKTTPMSPADIGGYTYQSAGMDNNNFWQQQNARAANLGGMYGLGGAALGAAGRALPFMISDRRMKRDIVRMGALKNGLPLYLFRYHDNDNVQWGVMADEVLRVKPEAVFDLNGTLAVDYSKLEAA